MKLDIKLLVFLFFPLACLTTCKRSTSVSGIITDVLTDLPVDGVTVSIEYATLKNGVHDVIGTATQVTNADGRYLLELEGSKNAELVLRIEKEGYVAFFPKSLNNSGVQEVNIKLRPKSCKLFLTIYNSKNYPLKFYSFMQGKFYGEAEKRIVSNPNPLEISSNSSITYTYAVPDSLNFLYYDTLDYKNEIPHNGLTILFLPNTSIPFDIRY
jgi:hypothetical protein